MTTIGTQISLESLERLAMVICGGQIEYSLGSNEYFTTPYRTMHDIEMLMKQVGLPIDLSLSRYKATIATLVDNNSLGTVEKLIQETIKPIKFTATGTDIDSAIGYMNEMFHYDGLQLDIHSNSVRLTRKHLSSIEIDDLVDIRGTGGNYIVFLRYYDDKIASRLQNEDYDGAITLAKTKVERQLDFIHETIQGSFDKKADCNQKYKAVAKLINLEVSGDIDKALKKILSGLFSIIDGMAQLRNEVADSHPAQYRAEKRHAILAVNASKTISAFLHDVCENQMHAGYPLVTWAAMEQMVDASIDFEAQRAADIRRGK